MLRPLQTAAARYAVGAALPALATVVRLPLGPWFGGQFPFATYFAAVVGAAWWAGFGPSLLALALSAALASAFLLPALGVTGSDWGAGLTLFLTVGLAIALMGGRMRAALGRAEASERAARRLLDAEQGLRGRLATTLRSIGEGVLTTDDRGLVVALNPVAEALTGWPSAEAAGRPSAEVFRVIVEATGEPAVSPVEGALREGRQAMPSLARLLVARDGAERAIEDSAAPILDESGRVLGAVLTFRDVDQRRRSERERASSEARKAAILETALDAIITIDRLGTVLEWNPAAEVTFGYPRAAAEGREMAALIVPDSLRDAHRRGFARFLETGEGPILGKRIEITARRADGSEFPAELAVTPIATHGELVFTAHARDISVRKAVERRRAVRLAVTQALAEAASPEEAAPRVLRALGEGLGWELGALWLADDAGSALTCRALWHAPTPGLDTLAEARQGQTLARGEGLPGQVWAGAATTRVAVPGGPDGAPRDALAVPVTVGDYAFGVLEFLTAGAPDADADLLDLLATAGGQLGLLIERGRAAAERRRLTAIIEHSPDFIGLADADQRVLFVNRAGRRLVGLSDETVARGTAVLDFFPDGERERVVRDALPELLDYGQWDGEVQFRNFATGATTPVLWNVFTIPDPQTGRAFFAWVSRDVTEARRAELDLRQSEERYRTLIEVSPQVVWESRADGEVTYFNPHWLTYTGLTIPESVGTGWVRAVHPDHRDRVRGAWASAAAGGGSYELEVPFRRAADGTYRWHLARGMPLRGERGQVARWAGVAIDIDEIKQAEHRLGFLAEAGTLLASSLDYRETLRNLAGLAAKDFADFCFVDLALDGGPERLGWAHTDPARREALGDAAKFVPPLWFEGHPIIQTLTTGRTQFVARIDDEWMRRAATSQEHYAFMRGLAVSSLVTVPIPYQDRTVGAITFGLTAPGGRQFNTLDLRLAEDLGRRAGVSLHNALLYQEAEQANRAKTQFLAVLSHELRTPLNPILLAASALLEAPADPTELRATLEMIRQNVNIQARLIDDLLDVMRIVRGKMPLHWEVVDCHAVIAQAVEICRAEVSEKGLGLTLDFAAHLRHVNADPARLQQVFWNLIKNAVKFTPHGGRIAIRTRTGVERGDLEGRIVIEVTDTGIGIESSVLPTVFDPFQQGETTITRTFGGLGLGLAICRGIVEAHGGALAAESPGKGQGTTFTVALRALPEPAIEAPAPAPAAPPAHLPGVPESLRILVVEDEPATLRLMARLLRGLGHEVRTANTIATALETFDAGAFDLIVSDIGLPDGSGLDLIRQIVARRGPVPAIALTGYGMEEDVQRSREAGFASHLTKPIDFKKLEAMIREVAPTRA